MLSVCLLPYRSLHRLLVYSCGSVCLFVCLSVCFSLFHYRLFVEICLANMFVCLFVWFCLSLQTACVCVELLGQFVCLFICLSDSFSLITESMYSLWVICQSVSNSVQAWSVYLLGQSVRLFSHVHQAKQGNNIIPKTSEYYYFAKQRKKTWHAYIPKILLCPFMYHFFSYVIQNSLFLLLQTSSTHTRVPTKVPLLHRYILNNNTHTQYSTVPWCSKKFPSSYSNNMVKWSVKYITL